MPYSIYEPICNNQIYPANVFVTTIQSSAFHWHGEYELIGILKGSVTMRVQSEVVTLKEGDIYLLNPNVIHALKEVDQEENYCVIIQISQELFSFGKDENAEIRFYLDSTQEEEPECGFDYFFRKMAEMALETLTEDRHQPFRIRAQMCTLIADLLDYVVYDVRFKEAFAESGQEYTVKIIEFLQQNLSEEKAADLACHQFGLSRKSLDRILKTTIGVTGKALIESLRMEMAKNLLKNTDKSINYILDTCGFGSEKTFYRVFRKETGLTPSEFRQKGTIELYNDTVKGYLKFETSDVRYLLGQILKE